MITVRGRGFGYPACMSDTQPTTDPGPRNAATVPGSENADWGHPGRVHATEEQSATAQSSTEPSGWAHPADADPQRRAGSHQGSADPADDLTGNTSGAPARGDGDDSDDGDDGDLGDATPGDGSVDTHPPSPDVDAVRTAAHGRETDAARSDTSDAAPTPIETPLRTPPG
jgi:hypothetical protein